eukprot:g7265.t1
MAARMVDRAHQHSFLLGIEQRLCKTVFDFASGEQLALFLRLLLEVTAQAGDLDMIYALQRAGAEGNKLHLAVRAGHGPHVVEQIKKGDSPDTRDANKDAPLHIAAARGDTEIVQVLLSSGADENLPDKNRRTPLHIAARNGHAETAEALLHGGAWLSPFLDSDGCSPLELALCGGHPNVVEVLVKHGADVDSALSMGRLPLHVAAEKDMVKLLESLAAAGASLDARDSKYGWTALHVAAENGCADAVRALIGLGARRRECDGNGHSPLGLASKKGHLDAALAILEADQRAGVANGANVRFGGQASPLELAARHGHAHVVGALLRHGANVNSEDFPGQPALHRAADGGHVDVLNELIKHGADLNAVDDDGETALHHAATFDHPEAIDVLVRAGAHIEAVGEDMYTPLHLACRFLKRDAARTLLAHGANVQTVDENGLYPLHSAVANGESDGTLEVVELLLSFGADAMALSAAGYKAVEVIGHHYDDEGEFSTENIERLEALLTGATPSKPAGS